MISLGKIPSKIIPYSVQIIIYSNDKKDYDENYNDTHRRMDKFIEKTEFHEKIHCFLYRLLRIPSVILYVFRYSSYFMAKGAFCMPIKSLTKFQTFLADILHFLWDQISDIFNPEVRKKENHQIEKRTPKHLVKEFFRNLFYWNQCENLFDFQSISDIKGFIFQMSDEIVEEWEKGKALFH